MNEQVHHQPDLEEQLKWELRQKNMFISKDRIQLSKVVGQGLYMHTLHTFSQQNGIFISTSPMQESQDWCTVDTLTVEVTEI